MHLRLDGLLGHPDALRNRPVVRTHGDGGELDVPHGVVGADHGGDGRIVQVLVVALVEEEETAGAAGRAQHHPE